MVLPKHPNRKHTGPAGASSRRCCEWCKETISEEDDHLSSNCGAEACDLVCCHVECLKEYLLTGRADCGKASSTKKKEKRALYIEKAPWAQLVSAACPRNNSKIDNQDENITPCSGRVITCDLIDGLASLRKKKLKMKGPSPTTSGPVGPAHKANNPKPHPKAAVKLAKCLPSKAGACLAAPQRVPRPRIPPPGGTQPITRILTRTTPPAEDDLQFCFQAPEELELAVERGMVPREYRTQLCSSLVGQAECNFGTRCLHAHKLSVLRVSAAIMLGRLPADFKTAFCKEFVAAGNCPNGLLCAYAHTVPELRVLAAIKAGHVPRGYKAQRCPTVDIRGHCATGGLLCCMAHSQREVRIEAAMQLPDESKHKLPSVYKLFLCEHYYMRGACARGEKCHFAHGVRDIRLFEGIRQKLILSDYKTQPCLEFQAGACIAGYQCFNFHDQDEQLPLLEPKSRLCPAIQCEVQCSEGDDCFFAHSTKELAVDLTSRVCKASDLPQDQTPGEEADESDPGTLSEASDPQPLPGHMGLGSFRGAVSSRASSDAGETTNSGTTIREPGANGDVRVVPLSVRQNKMPASSGMPASKRKHGQGGKPPPGVTLCRYKRDMGRCPIVDCPYAHSEEDIKANEIKWRNERAAEKARRLAERHALQQAVAESSGQRLPRLAAPALDAMRRFKREACMGMLLEMGYPQSQMEWALQGAGADITACLALLTGEANASATAVEIDVTEEVGNLLSLSQTLGVAVEDAEAAVTLFDGNYEAAMQSLQQRSLEMEAAMEAQSSHAAAAALYPLRAQYPTGAVPAECLPAADAPYGAQHASQQLSGYGHELTEPSGLSWQHTSDQLQSWGDEPHAASASGYPQAQPHMASASCSAQQQPQWAASGSNPEVDPYSAHAGYGGCGESLNNALGTYGDQEPAGLAFNAAPAGFQASATILTDSFQIGLGQQASGSCLAASGGAVSAVPATVSEQPSRVAACMQADGKLELHNMLAFTAGQEHAGVSRAYWPSQDDVLRQLHAPTGAVHMVPVEAGVALPPSASVQPSDKRVEAAAQAARQDTGGALGGLGDTPAAVPVDGLTALGLPNLAGLLLNDSSKFAALPGTTTAAAAVVSGVQREDSAEAEDFDDLLSTLMM